jgi:hypothetical protein
MSPYRFERYGRTRYWAVMAGNDLLAVVVYRKGAAALVALLLEFHSTRGQHGK